ncbi:hypothetical protein AGMMS49982_13350 [Bacteroidia bacterium]|nr:hypothetical protein AGMMS49982_13350 [Bacteroidia bacterium]
MLVYKKMLYLCHMKQRVYIDTSVVGGYFDAEFANDTVPFFESVKRGEMVIIVSDLLEKELVKAPAHVRVLLDTIPSDYVEHVFATVESDDLAREYIKANVVGQTSFDDCRHIAIATLCKADVLVSWNFKHIVNFDKIKGYNGINLLFRYSTIDIRSPKVMMKYENNS